MKKMTKEDVEVAKSYLEKANHAVGHAFEAAAIANDIRCEQEIDAAIDALQLAKARIHSELKNYERFAIRGGRAALKECENDPATMRVAWAFAEWLWIDYSADRLTYLRNMEKARILKSDGYKEIKKLEKLVQKKGGAK